MVGIDGVEGISWKEMGIERRIEHRIRKYDDEGGYVACSLIPRDFCFHPEATFVNDAASSSSSSIFSRDIL